MQNTTRKLIQSVLTMPVQCSRFRILHSLRSNNFNTKEPCQSNLSVCATHGTELGSFHPVIGHEGPQGEQRYSSTLFLTSALEGGEGSASRPGRTLPRERPGTRCTGGWVGLRAGLDGCGKSRPHRDSIPGPSSPLGSRYTDYVTRPTEANSPIAISRTGNKNLKKDDTSCTQSCTKYSARGTTLYEEQQRLGNQMGGEGSPGTWQRVDWYVITKVLELHAVCIPQICCPEFRSSIFPNSTFPQSTRPHGVITQQATRMNSTTQRIKTQSSFNKMVFTSQTHFFYCT